jgi:hypothetical protein
MEGLARAHGARLLAAAVGRRSGRGARRRPAGRAPRHGGGCGPARGADDAAGRRRCGAPPWRHWSGSATAQALDALQAALDGRDREVRISAARGLASLRYGPARPRLEELLDSHLVREADLTEKIAFFEAYGAVAGEPGVRMLDRMLNGRRLLGRESPEMRACAAWRWVGWAPRLHAPRWTARQRRSEPGHPQRGHEGAARGGGDMSGQPPQTLVQSDTFLHQHGRALMIALHAASQSLRIYPRRTPPSRRRWTRRTACCGGCWTASRPWSPRRRRLPVPEWRPAAPGPVGLRRRSPT